MSVLKQVMVARGWSQNRLALESKIPGTSICQAFKGRTSWFPSWRKRISMAVDMDEDELFTTGGVLREAE